VGLIASRPTGRISGRRAVSVLTAGWRMAGPGNQINPLQRKTDRAQTPPTSPLINTQICANGWARSWRSAAFPNAEALGGRWKGARTWT